MPADPEHKLTMVHAFKDHLKEAEDVKLSPNERHLAIKDGQNRIFVIDTFNECVINVWKGYHHAQVKFSEKSLHFPNNQNNI